VRPHQLLADCARGARKVVRGETTTHLHLRERLLTALFATILVDAIATIAIFLVERHAPQSDITSIGSAAFWTTSQLLTVSSSLGNPISNTARVIDVGLELYAITVVTAVAGSFAAFFHRRSLERDPLPHDGSGGRG
jgi:hypothetical protein